VRGRVNRRKEGGEIKCANEGTSLLLFNSRKTKAEPKMSWGELLGGFRM